MFHSPSRSHCDCAVSMCSRPSRTVRQVDDPQLLTRATSLDRVLFSQDKDLLVVTSQWQERGTRFAGVIYAPQMRLSIGQCVSDLELTCTYTSLRPDSLDEYATHLPSGEN